MANEDGIWALKNFQKKLEKITNLEKDLSSENCAPKSSFYRNEPCSHTRSHSIGRSVDRTPQSERFRSHSSERNSFASTPSSADSFRERQNVNRFVPRRHNIEDRLIEMKTICECLNEFERCVLKKSRLARDLTKSGWRTSRDESTNSDHSNSPIPRPEFSSAGGTEPRPGSFRSGASELRPSRSGGRISGESANEPIPGTSSASANEPRPGISADRSQERPVESNQQLDLSQELNESNANSTQRTNDSSISDISFDPSILHVDDSDQSAMQSENDSIPADYRPLAIPEIHDTDGSSSENSPRSGSPSSRYTASSSLRSGETRNSANPNVQKQDLESVLRGARPGPSVLSNDNLPSSPPQFPVVSPPLGDLAAENAQNKILLQQKLNRMYELKRAYYSDPSDDMPYIDVTRTRHGVFTDEPIDSAFVYEDGTVPSCAAKGTNAPCRSDYRRQSGFRQHFSPLQLDTVAESFPFPGTNQRSITTNYTEWVDKVIEENVLHEFERKVNQLRTTSSSDKSSPPEQVSRRKKINIPKKSLHFPK